jgi:tetratricopeptide (TPR) repeat protein
MFVYALTIFTGAFLLFQVQPLIGKYILPWFGGATGVWTTCMLFFQMLLLGGYAYAHFTSRWLKPRRQAIVHLALLAAALALLPITPADSWKPDGGGNPTLQILVLLTVSLGLPYFVLSSTGPLMQHWFSRTNPGVSPYRLYALSNFGSLLALISFPVYFETHFTRKAQAGLWGWGLVLYAIGCGFCAIKLWKTKGVECRVSSDEGGKSEIRSQASATLNLQPSTFNRLLWLLLPACASVLLLATTNKMCQEVAVIPFLWVLPLALYLLSFIICFDNPRWYARLPFMLALMAAWGGIGWALFKGPTVSIQLQLSIYSAGLFICCMVCHGELYRLRPDPRHLTGFYLMIAAGGALGGFFVAVIAPLVFTDYFELQWGLLLCGLLLLLVCARDRNPGSFKRWRLPACVCLLAGLVALGIALWRQAHQSGGLMVYRSRNFYGVLKVMRQDNQKPDFRYLELAHGRTLHGLQFVDPPRAAWPTLYYSEHSGVGLAMRALPTGPRRIGLIGLGTGTLATYAQAGDYVHIYEINPEVERLATSWFTYLTNCPGKVEVTLGDARLSLEREPPQDFDLLVLDAFNSDAIPVHLLTREAFAIYERHLKTNGIMAVHVSNLSVNLEPVVVNLARHFNYEVATIDYNAPRDKPWILRSVWMLLSRSQEIINSPALRRAARPPQTNSISVPLWTDDFASLFQVLRSEASPIDPAFSEAQIKIAQNLCQQGDFAGAVASYRLALQTHPDLPDLLNNLGWLLATCPDAHIRDGAQAVKHAGRACELTHYGVTPMVGTLAAAYAEAGRFDDAISMAEKACMMASESGDQDLLKRNQELLALYLKHQPYHEPLEKLVPAAP